MYKTEKLKSYDVIVTSNEIEFQNKYHFWKDRIELPQKKNIFYDSIVTNTAETKGGQIDPPPQPLT